MSLPGSDAWCASAADGSGRTVFIGGEPGIGKSALLRAMLGQARGLGARVAIGRCEPLSTPRSLGPFVEISEQIGTTVGGDRDRLFAALLREFRASGPHVIAL